MSVVKEPLQKVNIGLVANIDDYKPIRLDR